MTSLQVQTIEDVKANIQLIQKVMGDVMKDGEHYGVVPGCGNKKTLLKPGAEKIMATFRISPELKVEDLSTADERRYRVTATGIHSPTGLVLGQGIGECSTGEEKFKWREAICDEEFDATPENRRRMKWKKGYGKPNFSVKQVRTEPADLANTVLKMSKKRAVIDMVLTATAASDIFVQDLEDEVVEAAQESQEPKEPAQKFNCNDCKKEVNQAVHDFSLKKYQKTLCMTCQKKPVTTEKVDSKKSILSPAEYHSANVDRFYEGS